MVIGVVMTRSRAKPGDPGMAGDPKVAFEAYRDAMKNVTTAQQSITIALAGFLFSLAMGDGNLIQICPAPRDLIARPHPGEIAKAVGLLLLGVTIWLFFWVDARNHLRSARAHLADFARAVEAAYQPLKLDNLRHDLAFMTTRHRMVFWVLYPLGGMLCFLSVTDLLDMIWRSSCD
jgi:hypothetical protein